MLGLSYFSPAKQRPSSSWDKDYIILLDTMLQDDVLFPCQSFIFESLVRSNKGALEQAWREANAVYFGPQRAKTRQAFIAEGVTTKAQEQEWTRKLGLDRFALPIPPSTFYGTMPLATYPRDMALLALCHDQAICANNRHAYSTYADALLKAFEADTLPETTAVVYMRRYINAHRDIWNYQSTKERFFNESSRHAEPEDHELAKESLNIQLRTSSLIEFIKELVEMTSCAYNMDIHLTMFAVFCGKHVYYHPKWLAAMQDSHSPAFIDRLKVYHGQALAIQRAASLELG